MKMTTIAGRPVTVKSKIDKARERFGQPFAHEPGTKWKPRSSFFLSDWLLSLKGKQCSND